MPSVIALSCPVCGAPLKPGDEKCTFCGAYIFIKSDLPRLDRHTLNQAVIQEHIGDFRRRVRADQYDEEAHYGLGVAYFSLGLTESAADELGQAARLMPENPHIQAQLAVVLRDLVRQGEEGYERKLRHHIDTALRLDPENLEALSVLAETLSSEGRGREAEQILSQIRRIDADRARVVEERVQIARIQRHLDANEWPAARPLIIKLQPTNPTKAKTLMTSYLALGRSEFPLALVEPARREEIKNVAWQIKIAGVIVGGAAFVAAVNMDVPALLGLLAFASVFVFPGLFQKAYLRKIAEAEASDAIVIDEASLKAEALKANDLLTLADAMYRYSQDELDDLNQLEPLEEFVRKK